MTYGIIVGTDASQEWLLPWWWERYRRHNPDPVAFFDFGMSARGKEWCKKRGQLIKQSPFFAQDRSEVNPHLVQTWEQKYGTQFWECRNTWFQKGAACLRSPFQHTIWIDLDCEIAAPLAPLYEKAHPLSGIALCLDMVTPSVYNSGVIVFQPSSAVIREWAVLSAEQSGRFRGDQDLLTHIIIENHYAIETLPAIYNWNVGFGLNPDVAIYHWLGESAKAALKNQLILDDFHS